MPEVQHRTLGPGSNHVNHDYIAASEAARLALPVSQADVGKDCLQTDTSPPTFWRLARVTGGVAWLRLGSVGGGILWDWTVDDSQHDGATAALGSLQTTPEDAGKVALLSDSRTLYVRTASVDSPWLQITTGSLDLLSEAIETLGTNFDYLEGAKEARDLTVRSEPGTAYTLALADRGAVVMFGATSPITVTIPTDAAVAFPVGARVRFVQGNTGSITFQAASGVNLLNAGGMQTVAYGSYRELVKLGANMWVLAPWITPGMPVAVGTANARGNSVNVALSDHVHDASHLAPKLFTVTSFATPTRTLALADNNTILMATAASTVEQVVTIPTDASLNLPIGYAVTLLNRSAAEAWFLPQVDFYPYPWSGTPDMFYLGEGVVTPGFSNQPYCKPGGAITAVKVGANLWWLSGNITAEPT